MIKKFISPLQNILIQKRLCPGCTNKLKDAQILQKRPNGTDVIQCSCSRIYIYDRKLEIYRRALPEEL